MNTLSAIRLLLALLVLPGGSACEKADPEADGLAYVGKVPYYHFTDDDRRWLQFKAGDEWRFQNAQGQQRIYQVSVAERLKKGDYSYSSGLPGSSKLLSYYDHTTVRANRIDTITSGVRGYVDLRFYRDAAMLTNLSAGGYDNGRSQFYAVGEFYEFVGNTDLISDYYDCRGLKFPRAAALNGPFVTLTVRGRQYTEVVAFVGTARGTTCPAVPSVYMQELYYDRQAGLVRMVSRAGEVWERVP